MQAPGHQEENIYLEHMGSVSADKHNLVGYGFNSKARRYEGDEDFLSRAKV